MLEMLLFFSALMMVLFIALYFIEVEPYRKKGFIQRIGELLLFSYRKVCEIMSYGLHYLKMKEKSAACDCESGINIPAQTPLQLYLTGHQRVDSSRNMHYRKYNYNLKILK